MAASHPTDRELTVAIIGFGSAGQVYHAPLIASVDGIGHLAPAEAPGRLADLIRGHVHATQ